MNVLVTGGTGSLGNALVPEFLHRGYNVSILNKDNHKQAAAKKSLVEYNIRWYLGDICDRDLLLDATRNQDIVIHAAAMKRIEMCAEYSYEAVRVNTEGAYNVARACMSNGVRKCLLISSDKAAESSTAYGSSKALAEYIWLNCDNSRQYFSAIRYGNVLNSHGSVLHLWRDAKQNNLPLLVREPEPTRFILNLTQAVRLITDALECMYKYSPCVFIPWNLPAFSLWDLAEFIESDYDMWTLTPLIHGEKQHEVLLAQNEHAEKATDLLWHTCSPYPMGFREYFASNITPNRLSAEAVNELMGGQ